MYHHRDKPSSSCFLFSDSTVDDIVADDDSIDVLRRPLYTVDNDGNIVAPFAAPMQSTPDAIVAPQSTRLFFLPLRHHLPC